jgi:hypothetical protein
MGQVFNKRKRKKVCIYGFPGKPLLCWQPELRENKTSSVLDGNPLYAMSNQELRPILHFICKGENSADCLDALANSESTSDESWKKVMSHRKQYEKPGVYYESHIRELIPPLCAKLTKNECHDYGRFKCRWNEDSKKTKACGEIIRSGKDEQGPFVWVRDLDGYVVDYTGDI